MRGAAWVWLAIGCGGIDYDEWPDLRGRYALQLTGIEGCAEDRHRVSWVASPLTIEGELPDLSYVFLAAGTFAGTSTEGGRFSFRGDVEIDDETLTVSGRGQGSGVPPQGALEGTVDVTAPSDGCSYVGHFSGTQVGT
jgi:hypothetical protein